MQADEKKKFGWDETSLLQLGHIIPCIGGMKHPCYNWDILELKGGMFEPFRVGCFVTGGWDETSLLEECFRRIK